MHDLLVDREDSTRMNQPTSILSLMTANAAASSEPGTVHRLDTNHLTLISLEAENQRLMERLISVTQRLNECLSHTVSERRSGSM